MDHPDAPSSTSVPTPPPTGRRPRGLLGPVLLATVLAVIAATIVLIVGGNGGSSPSGADSTVTSALSLTPPPDQVGKPVPTTAFQRWNGGKGTAADYKGKPLVVNFWSSTCVPCVKEMPAFQHVHEQMGDKVAFLGLAVIDNRADAQKLAERTGVRYDLGFDPQGKVITAYGGVVLPTTVLVSPTGRIVMVHTGAMSASDLRTAIHDKLHVAS